MAAAACTGAGLAAVCGTHGSLPSRTAATCQLAVADARSRGVGHVRRHTCALRSAFAGRDVAGERRGASGEGRREAGAISCSNVQKVSAKELTDMLVLERTVPIVVDFYATWCGPCLLLAQELEKLALEYDGQVKFLKVDTDEEYELASQLEIRGLPTMIFLSRDKDKLGSRVEGLHSSETIRGIIAEL